MSEIRTWSTPGKADAHVVDLLRAAEAAPTKPVVVSLPVQTAVPGSDSEHVGVTTEADSACPAAPSNWDWNGDATWFAQNFCPSGTQYCQANKDDPSDRRGGHPQSDSWHFNQSFCQVMTWSLSETWGCLKTPFSTSHCTQDIGFGGPGPRFVDYYGWRANGTDVNDFWPTYYIATSGSYDGVSGTIRVGLSHHVN